MKASTASLLIEDASRLLWCPAGTAAADRRQREGTEEGTELITTTATTISRHGKHWPFEITPSLTLTTLRKECVFLSARSRKIET